MMAIVHTGDASVSWLFLLLPEECPKRDASDLHHLQRALPHEICLPLLEQAHTKPIHTEQRVCTVAKPKVQQKHWIRHYTAADIVLTTADRTWLPYLESDSWNISHSMASSAKSCYENLILHHITTS